MIHRHVNAILLGAVILAGIAILVCGGIILGAIIEGLNR